VTNNRRLDFGGEPDHVADPGIFKGILPFRDSNNFTNFGDNSRSCQRVILIFFQDVMRR